jgi:hypothetical protein
VWSAHSLRASSWARSRTGAPRLDGLPEGAARQIIFKMTAMRRGDFPPMCDNARARAPVTAGRLKRRRRLSPSRRRSPGWTA